ncbi:alpha/beta hydrolase [Rubritalea spongiae]|uniref:Alpha/beta hydrolase n=1 Tax=Rubritalea spongiae TaxID=430797 RepID=A0ABW5DXY7_9BACT
MKYFLLFTLTLLLTGAIHAQSDKVAREKYSWTLGYKPDELITFYTPKPDMDLKLHVFYPEGHKRSNETPCIVFYFGGGWSGGSPDQFYGISKYLASRGMVAISAQYRTKKQKAIPRDCVEDGREAIRYVREHATEIGVDPERIAAGGGSAGGHVAAAVGMCPQIDVHPNSKVSSIPDALVLFNPVYHNGPEGYGHSRVTDYWREISPYHNIREGLPPTIVFFGSDDHCIKLPLIQAFQTDMEKAGNECVTHIYDKEKHGFFHISKGGRKIFEDVMNKVDGFLVEHKFLSGESEVEAWTAKAIEHYKAERGAKQKSKK